MSNIKEIQRAISNHFGSVVSIDKLSMPNRSKTVIHAKSIGIYIARKDGHSNDDIAKAFGYKSTNAVSRVFHSTSPKISSDSVLARNVRTISEILSIDIS